MFKTDLTILGKVQKLPVKMSQNEALGSQDDELLSVLILALTSPPIKGVSQAVIAVCF